jgi:hypothetical protein
MATHVKVLKAADGGTEIPTESLTHSIAKDLHRFADSDGANNWGDDNRYLQTVKVSGTVTRTGMEYLISTATMAIGATYPQIVVYNKSAADYYNTYSGVAFESLDCTMITDDEWGVSCVFKW